MTSSPSTPDVDTAAGDAADEIDAIRGRQGDSWAAFALKSYEGGLRSVAVIKPNGLTIFELAVEISSDGSWTPADFLGSEDALAFVSGTDDIVRITFRSPYGVRVAELTIEPLG